MRDPERMELQAEALHTHDAAGRLVRVREHDSAPAPRFFLGRIAGGVVCRCRHDVDDTLCRALVEAATEDPVDFAAEVASDGRAANPARYAKLLAGDTPGVAAWGGPAFHFPTQIADPPIRDRDAASGAVVLVTEANVDVLRALHPAWLPDVHLSPPLMAHG